MKSMPRCRHCGDVIGAYEPVIVVQSGEARETSRAAEPELVRHAACCYHRECHEASHGADGSIHEQPNAPHSD